MTRFTYISLIYISICCLIVSFFCADAFLPAPIISNGMVLQPTLLEMVVDPIMLGAGLNLDVAVEVGIALASAAAGAMTQIPRVQQLERELEAAKFALTASELDLVEKIRVLEDKLFVMDQEFEEQTVKFQRQYDKKQKDQIEAFKEKIKTDMAFKLDIQIEQDRSAKLLKQADNENGRTLRQGELSQLKLQQMQLNDMNAKLEEAIAHSDEEIERLRAQAVSRKKSFLFW